jgi:hypothetical protein
MIKEIAKGERKKDVCHFAIVNSLKKTKEKEKV